jgi:hypothetical protein
MLQWSSRARSAIRVLFESLQDIDVYVEDSDDEVFYRALLNFASNKTIKIARVFALKGRANVEAAAKVHDFKKRRALFIIDGDLGWVKGHAAPRIRGLHQHDAYCVENLLICEKAIVTLVAQEITVVETSVATLIDFKKWKSSVIGDLSELFAAYATLNDFDATVATVSNGVGVLCSKNPATKQTNLDSGKLKKAKDGAIVASEAVAGKAAVAAKFGVILARVRKLPDPLHAISGKDYVIPLLDFHLQSVGCRIRRKSLLVRLASSGDYKRFDRLRRAMRSAAVGA